MMSQTDRQIILFTIYKIQIQIQITLLHYNVLHGAAKLILTYYMAIPSNWPFILKLNVIETNQMFSTEGGVQ